MRLTFAIGLRRNYGKDGALNEEKRHDASDCGRIGLMRSKWIVIQEGSGRIGKSIGEIADQRLSSPTTPANPRENCLRVEADGFIVKSA